ncbi:MAG: hypothetical protein IPL61_26925 [Myxococcales bacterium]|nr:hypothetical protein [Myxococcales bacterium]
MARSVHQILGLLGTKDPATVLVYPLAMASADVTRARVASWAGVWGADFGRLTASITSDEKAALVEAGAREQPTRE